MLSELVAPEMELTVISLVLDPDLAAVYEVVMSALKRTLGR